MSCSVANKLVRLSSWRCFNLERPCSSHGQRISMKITPVLKCEDKEITLNEDCNKQRY